MKPNVIILTSGLTGSSVLTGLISQAGYWTGENTHKKKDYDTFENVELIDLNLRIFKEADYQGDYLTQFSSEALARMNSLAKEVEGSIYRAFVEKCNQHGPWVWKDPRLWMTIHFWKDIFPLEDCKFIVLTRSFRQLWVSTMLRRQIVSYRGSRAYEQHVRDSAIGFLEQNRLSYLPVRYEDLIVHPAETIAKLNGYLETSLTVDHLRKIYRKPLYKVPASSLTDFIKALLIYVKNYSERVDVAVRPN
jgi:hypothetical protein